MTYTGRATPSAEAARRLEAGETLGPDQVHFVIAPTFETTSPTYGWLNDILTVGKIISLNRTHNRHVTYDIFAIK